MTTHDSNGQALMEMYLSNKHGAGVDIGSYNPEAARGICEARKGERSG